MSIERLKALFGLWLLSLAFWSYGPLGLRIRSLVTLRLWSLLGLWISSVYRCYSAQILSEVLEVYFKALVYIVYVQVLLWTQKKFTLWQGFKFKDLAQALDFQMLNWFGILWSLGCLMFKSPKNGNSMLTKICQTLSPCWLDFSFLSFYFMY